MGFANFNLDEYYKTYSYFIIYLDLRFKKDKIKRSEILQGADIYQSAFSIARKVNFVGKEEIIKKFENYYHLDSLNQSDILELKENCNNLFLGIYYVNDELKNQSYRKIVKQKEKLKNTYISVVIDLMELFYLVSIKGYNIKKDGKNYIEKLERIRDYYDMLIPELKILFLLVSFSILKYETKDLNKAIVEMDNLIVNYPFLEGFADYKIAYMYHRLGYYDASIQYYKDSLKFMIDDINLKRIEYVQINLLISYGNIGANLKAYNQGRNLLLHLNSGKDNEDLLNSVNYNMALICIQLDKYEEALQYIKNCYDYDKNKLGKVSLFMFICYSINDYEMVEKLYDDNKEKVRNSTVEIYKKAIELIYQKTIKGKTKSQLKKDWKDLKSLLEGTNNYNVERYIDKLK